MAKVKHYSKMITFWLDKDSVEKIDAICGNTMSRAEWLRNIIHKKLSESIE